MDNYSGGQADGRFSTARWCRGAARASSSPLNSDPTAHDGIPILHGNPYGPAVTKASPTARPARPATPLGEALLPGQGRDNPTFGVARHRPRPLGIAAARQDRPLPDQNGDRDLLGPGDNLTENPTHRTAGSPTSRSA